MNDWETFQKAYRSAPDATKKLIESTTIPACIEAELVARGESLTLKRDLINIYTRLRLGVILREDAADQISSLGINEGDEFIAHIDLRVAKTKAHVDGIEAFEKELVPTATNKISNGSKPTQNEEMIKNDIAETEAALAHLSTTRTMASDAQVIKEHRGSDETPVHQSTQPSLRPGKPYQRPNASTWGDD